MKTQDALDWDASLARAGERVEHILRRAPGVVRTYTAYLAGACGKMIRAGALLASAMGEDGLVPPEAVDLAAAVELVHLATLVHDDVIDDADTRRGIPTLGRQFGRRRAVICGDYLLSVALRAAGEAAKSHRNDERTPNLPDYVGRIALGELWQEENQHNYALSAYRYLRIIGGKTAALFEASYRAGALLYTGDGRLVELYARLGREVGMIFQLNDDLLDFEADEAAAKKPVRSDFEQGVVTLPVIHAFARDPSLRARAERGALSADELEREVRRTGGLDCARRMTARYYKRARELSARIAAPEEKARRLDAILERAYRGLAPAAAEDRRVAVNPT